MTSKVRKKQKAQRKNQYVNRSYNDFRNELLNHAGTYFSAQNRDFSTSSLGGMLLDFAAIVGDSLSFYVEQQFNELNPETATNTENVIKHLRNAGINNTTNSPSSVYVTFLIEVGATSSTNVTPNKNYLPIIKSGTRIISNNGIEFSLVEDIDFSSGYESEVGEEDASGNIETLILSKKGLCISGQVTSESLVFSNDTQNNFLTYELENEDVTDILLVIDEDLNRYHEVEYLTQNTIYKKVDYSKDSYFEIVPAIFRFIRETNFANGRTILRFGNGDGAVLKDNILDNPEDILIPLKQTDYFSNKSLDPNKLLKSNSLGVSPKGKRVNIRYRHGGGQNHNVPVESIDEILEIKIIFPEISSETEDNVAKMTEVMESADVINEEEAVGGSDSLSLEELKLYIPNALKMQSRIITHEDLIGRIYTMPTNFGRINKVAAIDNPYSNGSKDLYVICKDINNFYIPASDAVKNNLSKYLNEFRLIGDNFNILDVGIFNFGIKIEIRVNEGYDIDSVRADLAFRIVENMRFDALQIGESIDTNGLVNVALNTDGVTSVITNQKNMITSKTTANNFFDEDTDDVLVYNDNFFNPISSYDEGFIYPDPGSIFEMRYSANDIEIIAN
jgi:hypothetical protein